MTTEKKITNRDRFTTLRQIIKTIGNDIEYPEGMNTDNMIEFIDRQIELIDNKLAITKRRAEEKKIAGDELRKRIYDVLSAEEYMTIDDVVAALNDPGVSPQAAVPRLSQLHSLGEIERVKQKIDIGDNKTKERTVYKKIEG